MAEQRPLATALLAVAVVFAALGIYYAIHKPFTPAQALALAGSLANLGTAAWLALVGGSVGRALLTRWLAGAARLSPGERAAASVALGWGALGLAMLALGAARLYSTPLLWALTIALLAVTWRSARGWLADWAAALGAWPLAARLDRWATAFVGFALGLGLLRALAPPLMWDALVYHLALPLRYAEMGGLQVSLAEFSVFTGMPQLAEMLYTAALLLRGDPGAGAVAAQTTGWLVGPVLVIGLAAWAQRLGASGPVAAAVLLASISVALSLAWAYADGLLMLQAVAMLIMLGQWQREPAPGWLVAAGVFGGLATGCKYTGALVPLSGAMFVLASSCAGQRVGERLRSVAWLVGAAGLAFAPWLAKNGWTTGSPVYPLLWPAADMDGLRLWFYNRPDLAERNLLRALAIGPRAILFGVQGGNHFDATLSPLLLALPLLVLAGWRGLPGPARAQLWPVAAAAAAGYLAWAALTLFSALAIQPRLFLGLLPPVVALGAAGLAAGRSLDTRAFRLSVFAAAAVALVLGLAAIELGLHFIRQNPLPYLAGEQPAGDYRAARLGWHAVALEHVSQLPAGSRVAFLWEARSLDCAETVTCLPDVIIDRWWHLRRTAGSAEAVLAGWRAAGVTHVLIYDSGAQFVQADPDSALTQADWAELDALRALLVQVEDIGGSYRLYALP